MVFANTFLVMGLGRSGEAVARLLLSQGHNVRVIDRGDNNELRKKADSLKEMGTKVILNCPCSGDLPFGGIPEDVFYGITEAIISPGIPSESPWVMALKGENIKIVSEIEIGWRNLSCPTIAVTGSKGKSSLVKLLSDIFIAAGKKVTACGNYGTPVSSIAVRGNEFDFVIVEVSSFQLEFIDKFKPAVAILLNIQPDHLDRHKDMDTYSKLKYRIFANMKRGDTAIVATDCLAGASNFINDYVRCISISVNTPANYRYVDGWILNGAIDGRKYDVRETYFDNCITGIAAAAAVAVSDIFGINRMIVERQTRCFVPLPHRMQNIGTIRGVKFINDSKATSLSALAGALTMCGDGIRLIAGGQLKEKDPSICKNLLAKKVKGVYLFGRDAQILEKAWSDVVFCKCFATMEEAVKDAFYDARDGEKILLSPGCASFDQFSGYEERGECFIKYMESLKNEGK